MENNVISMEEAKQLHDALEGLNEDKKVLEKAREDAQLEMDSNPEISVIEQSEDNIEETKKDYLEAFSPYGLTDNEATQLLSVILEYRVNMDKNGVFAKLPEKIQNIAKGFTHVDGRVISNDTAAAVILDQFVNDAKMNNTLNSYIEDMNSALGSMGIEYDAIFSKATDEIFDRIDDLEVTDPEKAEKLKEIKKSFENSKDYFILINGMVGEGFTKKFVIKKYLNMYISRVYMFNKTLMNGETVKFPDISEMIQIIHDTVGRDGLTFSDDVYKIFSVIIINEVMRLNLDGEENVSNLAYAYRLINNIYTLKYISNYTESQRKTVDSIIESLRVIENKIK